jgi:hypothetical protein
VQVRSTGKECKVSFVVTSRNDNHGRDLLRRMQIFIKALLAQCARHGLVSELVLVEWNPPSDRPGLAEALSWPVDGGPCKVRIIEVPNRIHRRIKHSDRLPLFQMIAKNVGIRRARGKFVLPTNIDILFSDELMRFMVSDEPRPGLMYRVDRVDVSQDVPENGSVDEQLQFCERNIIRICSKYCTLTHTDKYRKTRDVFPWIERIPATVLFLIRPLVELDLRDFQQRYQMCTPIEGLHTNASGDFMLMSKEDWETIKGHPELEIFSMHLDGLTNYIAYYSGIREVVLGAPIYHIEHAGGWTPEVENDRSLYARLDNRGVPHLTYERLKELVALMRRDRKPLIFNDDSWGLAEFELPERSV